jgi:hypothetical protein
VRHIRVPPTSAAGGFSTVSHDYAPHHQLLPVSTEAGREAPPEGAPLTLPTSAGGRQKLDALLIGSTEEKLSSMSWSSSRFRVRSRPPGPPPTTRVNVVSMTAGAVISYVELFAGARPRSLHAHYAYAKMRAGAR